MEALKYKYGCVMIEVPIPNWDEIISIINPEDIYITRGGIQETPHITLLYGLYADISEEMIKDILKKYEGINIDVEIDGIGIFENEEFDVVKFNIKNNYILEKINKDLSELPNIKQFPNYIPHVTISFVKAGTGNKYINKDYKFTINNIHKITYSSGSDKKCYISI